MQKQWDELLQRDAEARQWIVDLLDEVGKERELKLQAEERSTALEQRAKLYDEAITWLRRERDEQRQTLKRLRLELGTICGEHDQAVWECDEAQQRISSLQAELDTTKAQKLEAKGAAARHAMDLAECSLGGERRGRTLEGWPEHCL